MRSVWGCKCMVRLKGDGLKCSEVLLKHRVHKSSVKVFYYAIKALAGRQCFPLHSDQQQQDFKFWMLSRPIPPTNRFSSGGDGKHVWSKPPSGCPQGWSEEVRKWGLHRMVAVLERAKAIRNMLMTYSLSVQYSHRVSASVTVCYCSMIACIYRQNIISLTQII